MDNMLATDIQNHIVQTMLQWQDEDPSGQRLRLISAPRRSGKSWAVKRFVEHFDPNSILWVALHYRMASALRRQFNNECDILSTEILNKKTLHNPRLKAVVIDEGYYIDAGAADFIYDQCRAPIFVIGTCPAIKGKHYQRVYHDHDIIDRSEFYTMLPDGRHVKAREVQVAYRRTRNIFTQIMHSTVDAKLSLRFARVFQLKHADTLKIVSHDPGLDRYLSELSLLARSEAIGEWEVK